MKSLRWSKISFFILALRQSETNKRTDKEQNTKMKKYLQVKRSCEIQLYTYNIQFTKFTSKGKSSCVEPAGVASFWEWGPLFGTRCWSGRRSGILHPFSDIGAKTRSIFETSRPCPSPYSQTHIRNQRHVCMWVYLVFVSWVLRQP